MNPLVSDFISKVLLKVKYRKVHPALAKELYDHIECLKEEYCDQGMENEEAYQKAIVQMGDPDIIGKELYHEHKPKMDWLVLISITALILIGGYVLISSRRDESIVHMLVYTGAGIAGFLVCYFLNYQRLEKYSVLFLLAGIGILLMTKKFGLCINGTQRNLYFGRLSVKTVVVAIPLFLLGAAGIMNRWKAVGMKHKILYGVIILASVVLTYDNYHVEGMLLTITLYLTAVLSIDRFCQQSNEKMRKKKVFIGSGLIICIAYGVKMWMEAYRIVRFYAWLYPEKSEYGYLFRNIRQLLAHAELFGDSGLKALDESALSIFVNAIKNYSFLYLVGKIGIIGGVLVISILFGLIVRSFSIVRHNRDCYGSTIMLSLSVFFTMQSLLGVMTHLGLLPIDALYVPFFSYDGSSILFQMSCLGLFLGVNRRKNILPEELLEKKDALI